MVMAISNGISEIEMWHQSKTEAAAGNAIMALSWHRNIAKKMASAASA
jgi:hypothetical protein